MLVLLHGSQWNDTPNKKADPENPGLLLQLAKTATDFSRRVSRYLVIRMGGRSRLDIVNGQVGAIEFLLGIEADAHDHFQRAVHEESARQRDGHTDQGSDGLRSQADAAHAAQRL